MQGEVPVGDYRVPLGKTGFVVPGNNCTVVTYGGAVHTAMEAAKTLSDECISVEVVDF